MKNEDDGRCLSHALYGVAMGCHDRLLVAGDATAMRLPLRALARLVALSFFDRSNETT